MRDILLAVFAASIPLVKGHIACYTPAMWGYNVTAEMFDYDNRPVTPLQQYTFDKWWFHGHLKYEPNPGDFFELPVGGSGNCQTACNKGATKYWATSEGSTDIRQGEYPCPGYPTSQFHTNGIDDLKGCALSIAYTSDVNSIKPEDLTVFSVNHTCVWTVNTEFQVPQNMPPCPPGGCICAWHWIHSVDSGSAQMYMNGFRCMVTGSTSNDPIGKPQVPVRCTGDRSKCNQGPQQPLYWYQAEGNNMFNGQYDPPYYLDEWGFSDGPQNGIFTRSDGTSNAANGSSSSVSSSSSTPTSTPSSTPAGNTPSSTPVGNTPSSTPVGNMPASSPAENGPSSSLPVYNYVGSSASLPPPLSSPAPSPTNNGQEMGQGSNTLSSDRPKKTCKSKNKNKRGKKRQEGVAQHLKHKRYHAGGHNH